MRILSLGQTLGYSHRLRQYVSCFAGKDLDSGALVRLLGCESTLPVGKVFDLPLQRDKSDDRHESFRLQGGDGVFKSIEEMSVETVLKELQPLCFSSFEEAMDSGDSLAVVQIRSMDYLFHRDFKSSVDLVDTDGDRVVLRYLANDAHAKSFTQSWQDRGRPSFALVGNKKVNRDWICVRIFGDAFKPKFNKAEWQKETMRRRRSKEASD